MRDALLHYLTGEHHPLERGLLCRELERIGVCSTEVPSVPQWEWAEALRELIDEGLVIESGSMVAINRERIAEMQQVEQGNDPQLELF